MVLGTGDLCPPTQGLLTEKDRELSRRVSKYWLQFARTGTPSCAGNPAWEQHKEGQDRTLLLGETIELKTDFVPAKHKHMAAFQATRVWNDWIVALP
ncbi:carboxylesterase family protein [Sorangium sp. So ce363]|uniref:carboxylesterase family protein n=1 Tax=unclassified Sorangium TaxID=2621164 RepID=UPI003F5F535C